MVVVPKGQIVWITSCVSEFEAIVSVLPFPVPDLASITRESLRVFDHSINSESQLAVILQNTSHTNERLRELYTDWVATVDCQSG